MPFAFYTMDYRKIYVCLIETRKSTLTEDSYYEQHHIIPKSEGGSDNERNIVKLTAREHYIAHLLLAKIYDDLKMHLAVTYMKTGAHKMRKFKFNSHLYAKIRKKLAKFISINNTGKPSKRKGIKTGKPAWNRGRKIPEDVRKKISEHTKNAMNDPLVRTKISNANKNKPSPMKGKHLSDEQRLKISEATKKGMSSAIVREKISTALKGKLAGKNNPMYGKSSWSKCTDEERLDRRQRVANSMKQLKWFNNGVKNVRARECPEGFAAGRLHLSK